MGSPAVHQVLHGYADGHRLLASSIKDLASADARMMLELSDASGRGAGTLFDPYLTGYLLPQSGLYALARTWFAPEMPRPGCVWTHTLILGDEVLGKLEEPSRLLALFRRPHGPHVDVTQYETPLNSTPAKSSAARPSFPVHVHAALIEAAYDAWPRPLLVRADTAAEFEPFVLAIWRQQWPGLRRVTTFCSGALSVRSAGDRPLWLQAGPESALRRHGASQPFDMRRAPLQGASRWAVVAAQDLDGPTGHATPLQAFLARAGGDSADAGLFPALVMLYALLPSPGSAPAHWKHAADAALRMAELEDRLPDTALGAALGARENTAEEAAVLRALIERGDTRFGVPERVGRLWRSDAGAALQLIAALATFEKRAAEAAIEAAAPHLSPTGLNDLSQHPSEPSVATVLRLIASRFSGLFLHEGFIWRFNDATMAVAESIASSVDELQLGAPAERELFARLIESGDDRWASFAFSIAADDGALVRHVLDAAAAGRDVGALWWLEVAQRSTAANEWLLQRGPSPRVLAGIATAAPQLSSKIAAGFQPTPWAEALASFDRESQLRPRGDDRRLCVMALAVGSRHADDPASVTLVDTAVAALFDEARHGSLMLPEREWISSVLPHDGKGRDWDLCERMVKLLVKVARRHNADPRTLRAARHHLIRASMEQRVRSDEGSKGPWWSSFLPRWR